MVIGCGAVGQSTIPLLPRYLDISFKQVTVLDAVDNSEFIKDVIAAGARFFVQEVNTENMDAVLSKHLKSGDFLLDVAYEIPTVVRINGDNH